MALAYPPPADELIVDEESGGNRRFLSGPLEFGPAMLITPSCSLGAQGTAGYGHPVRTLVPVLPLAEVVARGVVKETALDDLRRFDHLINYMYLPPPEVGELEFAMPECVALLYMPVTLHHAFLEGQRVAQLAYRGAQQLQRKWCGSSRAGSRTTSMPSNRRWTDRAADGGVQLSASVRRRARDPRGRLRRMAVGRDYEVNRASDHACRRRMRHFAMGVIVRWLASAAVIAVATGSATAAEPARLHGAPLIAKTGLRLLVANVPPLLVDVDSGRVTRITDLPLWGRPVLSVLAVGKAAVVWLDRPSRGVPRAEIYVVRHDATKATRLATAWDVAPSSDRRAIWLKSFADARHCTLRELWLDGQARRRAQPVPCSTRLVDSGSGALLVQGSSVVDPASGRTVLRSGGIWAMAGRFALTGGSKHGLALSDLRTGSRWRLGWPSGVGGATSQGGIDQAAVTIDGKFIAVSFSDPAWQGGGTQVTDVWLLNPLTRSFQHLPDMPAAVSLKFTSMTWASRERLVMLAQSARHDVVAVWRPGQRQIQMRRVQLPERNSGSDSFIVWSAR